MRVSQEQAILSHLKRGRKITAITALNKFSCFRLSARILALRQAGYQIVSKSKRVGKKTVAEYRLVA